MNVKRFLMLSLALALLGASECTHHEQPGRSSTFFQDDPGSVRFRLVLEEGESREEVLTRRGGELPATEEIIVHEDRGGQTSYYLVNKTAELDGSAIEFAEVKTDEITGGPVLLVVFKPGPEGADKLGLLTESNIGKKLAIEVQGRVVSAPVIQSRIGDRARITGLTQEEIDSLQPDRP